MMPYTVNWDFSLTVVIPSRQVVNSVRPPASFWRPKNNSLLV